ncbi:MAG: hypothetical protein NTY64_14870 [Deltaproteobacteria bacterium]|nr:hypothetical protein [Deltaproteobacteria bacterium]
MKMFIVVFSLLFLAIGLPAHGADVIKIGVIGPMNFVQGKGHWNGATMAAEERSTPRGASRLARKR